MLTCIRPCFRIPSLPSGTVGGSEEGYRYETEAQKKASWYIAMDTLGLLGDNGCQLSYDRYFDTSFMIPFKLSHELQNFDPALSERIIQPPTVKNGRSKLYLQFSSPTTYVLRSD